ncbi:TIR domain-containing protein [Lacipirellula sp.]|uniref:toll/interleukin-1 receptor domain-containing protein n=1 Tax=Lacipirellula sp. TaxID=2691419 RepID=UPI003D0E2EC7
MSESSAIDIFVSHSSRDAELAKALVELFRRAYNLPSAKIRCTSVAGYKLPAGADTNEQLRRETVEARALVGIITEVSRDSAYVLFELGARWGAKKYLVPLLGAGHGPEVLAGPLTGLNALSCSRDDLLQLVRNIATELGYELEPAESYSGLVDAVVRVSDELAVQRGLETPEDAAEDNSSEISDPDCDYLREMSRPRNNGRIGGSIDDWEGREAAEAKATLSRLRDLNLVDYKGDFYELTNLGWLLADQLWHLKILDALPSSGSVKHDELKDTVELSDGVSEYEELERLLTLLETEGLVKISKTRGPWHVRITMEGLTQRKHRTLKLKR